MLVGLVAIHQAALDQIVDDVPIGVFEPHAAKGRHRIDEAAGLIHRDQHGQVVLAPGGQIIDAVSGRRMHNAGAVFGAHVIGGYNIGVVLLDRQEGVERLVAPTDQIAAPIAIDDLVFIRISQYLVLERVSQDQLLDAFAINSRSLDLHIVDIGAYRQSRVSRQCPGRGRPGEHVHARLAAQREAHVDAGIGDSLVTLRDLVRAQRRA